MASLSGKILKSVLKIIIGIGFLLIALFCFLYLLHTLNVLETNIFASIDNSWVGQKILELRQAHSFKFDMIFSGSIILFGYGSIWLFLGMIPFGKIPRIIINWIIGVPITLISIILILVGSLLLIN